MILFLSLVTWMIRIIDAKWLYISDILALDSESLSLLSPLVRSLE